MSLPGANSLRWGVLIAAGAGGLASCACCFHLHRQSPPAASLSPQSTKTPGSQRISLDSLLSLLLKRLKKPNVRELEGASQPVGCSAAVVQVLRCQWEEWGQGRQGGAPPLDSSAPQRLLELGFLGVSARISLEMERGYPLWTGLAQRHPPPSNFCGLFGGMGVFWSF